MTAVACDNSVFCVDQIILDVGRPYLLEYSFATSPMSY